MSDPLNGPAQAADLGTAGEAGQLLPHTVSQPGLADNTRAEQY
jgi:hypothetical protein